MIVLGGYFQIFALIKFVLCRSTRWGEFSKSKTEGLFDRIPGENEIPPNPKKLQDLLWFYGEISKKLRTRRIFQSVCQVLLDYKLRLCRNGGRVSRNSFFMQSAMEPCLLPQRLSTSDEIQNLLLLSNIFLRCLIWSVFDLRQCLSINSFQKMHNDAKPQRLSVFRPYWGHLCMTVRPDFIFSTDSNKIRHTLWNICLVFWNRPTN